MTKKKLKPYVVFSNTRDIFFGYCEKSSVRMILRNARRVYYYPAHPSSGGPDTLAVFGPGIGAKVGPETVETTVENVANAVAVTPSAEKVWGSASWSK